MDIYTKTIKDALARRPFHRLIKNDTYQISDRIKEIDPYYFILFNTVNKKYEVHNCLNIGDTFCFNVQDGRLDYRTLKFCRESSVDRNMLELYDKINDRIDERKAKSHHNLMRDMAEDMAERMINATDNVLMREGYSKYHVM